MLGKTAVYIIQKKKALFTFTTIPWLYSYKNWGSANNNPHVQTTCTVLNKDIFNFNFFKKVE